MYKVLSAGEKRQCVKRVLAGASLVQTAREAGISRTILYKWIKEYKNTGRRGRQTVLTSKIRKGKDHWKRLGRKMECRILKTALKNPEYSPGKIARMAGLSASGVWIALKRYSLNTQKLRLNYLDRCGTVVVPQIAAQDRLLLISRYEAGEKISSICRDFHISRTIFYRWLKRFRATNRAVRSLYDHRPRAERHWKSIDGKRIKKLVINVVLEHPDYSALKISNALINKENKPIAGVSYIHKLLVSLGLNTYKKRIQFISSYKTISNRLFKVPELKLPELPRYYFQSFLSPPVRSYVLLYVGLLFVSFSFLCVGLFVILYNSDLFNDVYSLKLLKNEKVLISKPKLLTGKKSEEKGPVTSDRKNIFEENAKEKIIYIVRAGDSLWKISIEIFGEAFYWKNIAEENKLINPNIINVGQELVIPIVEKVKSIK